MRGFSANISLAVCGQYRPIEEHVENSRKELLDTTACRDIIAGVMLDARQARELAGKERTMEKAFETWQHQGLRFVAFPFNRNVAVIDEDGGSYGSWHSVNRFRKLQCAGDDLIGVLSQVRLGSWPANSEKKPCVKE